MGKSIFFATFDIIQLYFSSTFPRNSQRQEFTMLIHLHFMSSVHSRIGNHQELINPLYRWCPLNRGPTVLTVLCISSSSSSLSVGGGGGCGVLHLALSTHHHLIHVQEHVQQRGEYS